MKLKASRLTVLKNSCCTDYSITSDIIWELYGNNAIFSVFLLIYFPSDCVNDGIPFLFV